MATLFEFDLDNKTHRLAKANQHFYVLEDRNLLPIRAWPAWCESCEKFTVPVLPSRLTFPPSLRRYTSTLTPRRKHADTSLP